MTDHDKTSAPDSPFSDHSSPTPAEPYIPDRSIGEVELLEYYPEEDKYRAYYDADRDLPGIAVVSAVAAVSGTDPVEMDPPLYATIDTDALDTLASPRGTSDGDIDVTFDFHGYEVTVSDYGCITLQPLSPTEISPSVGD